MKLLEFLLWFDCPMNCDFCFFNNIDRNSSEKQKNDALIYTKECIDNTDWSSEYDSIALVGGEVFGSFLPLSVKTNIVDLVKYIIVNYIKTNKIKNLYLLTSLLEPISDVLHNIISLIKEFDVYDNVWINTSWDSKYRFKNEKLKKIWYENIDYLKSNNIHTHIEMILSQFMIDKCLSDDKETIEMLSMTNVDLLRPELPINTNRNFLQDHFIQRKTFFNFLQKLSVINKELFDRLCNQEMRAKTIHLQPLNKIAHRKSDEYIEDVTLNNISGCGHDSMYRYAYQDQDGCLICDINLYKGILNG